MVARKEWYQRVNAALPNELPPMTAAEAVRAAKKLWRWGMQDKCWYPIRVTSGRRYTWEHGGVLYVNPDRGWDTFCHDMSHLLWRKANGNAAKPHEKGHAKFELSLRKEVVKRGWLTGVLKDQPKPEKRQADPRVEKLRRIVVRMDQWEAKKRRAENAIKKLSRSRRAYERNGVQLTA